VANTKHIRADSVFHLFSKRCASSDEIMFALVARELGLDLAEHLATKFRWQCQPLSNLLRAGSVAQERPST
jgi:hypothetical protein